MTMTAKEQEDFLEECQLEFSDRYTDADIEYKKTYDAGIPSPPIMYPWYGRPNLVANRNRAGGSQRSGYREYRYENNYRDRDRERDQQRENERDHRHQDGDRDQYRENDRNRRHHDRDRDQYRENDRDRRPQDNRRFRPY